MKLNGLIAHLLFYPYWVSPRRRDHHRRSFQAKAISPDLVGIFFEDISYAADGGLYGELIQNRSFEYAATEHITWNSISFWTLATHGDSKGSLAIDMGAPVHPNNPHCVVVKIDNPGDGVGLVNSGFDGIPVRAGEKYDVSFFARQCHMDNPWDWKSTIEGHPMPVTVILEAKDGKSLGEASFEIAGYDWKRQAGEIIAAGTDDAAHFVLLAKKKGGRRPRRNFALPAQDLSRSTERPARRPRASHRRP